MEPISLESDAGKVIFYNVVEEWLKDRKLLEFDSIKKDSFSYTLYGALGWNTKRIRKGVNLIFRAFYVTNKAFFVEQLASKYHIMLWVHRCLIVNWSIRE